MSVLPRTLNVESSPDSRASRPYSALHLRNGGTSVIFDVTDELRMVHWGEKVSDDASSVEGLVIASRPQRVSGGLDQTPTFSAFATPAHGWLGTPALEGHRRGTHFSAKLAVVDVESDTTAATITFEDTEVQLSATLEIRVGDAGLVHQRVTVHNLGDDDYELQSLMLGFTLPWDATEVLDTTGHHLRERSPQRRKFTVGTHLRESRRGRPGADSTLLMAVGAEGFAFETGLVHGVHLAWSGNHRILAERAVTGESFLAAGELFSPGEVMLAPGESITTPWAIGSWGTGLNELSARFHAEWRARPQHPSRPRPVTLNTWEAVYFDHSLEKLSALADTAAEVGVERFVLDDGWFLGRRDDTAGLGDWFVDEAVWPLGLHPLADYVLGKGMEFGLWVEPEMINPDSDLARAHPEWIMHARRDLPPTARQQQVLNLSHPDAYAFIAERLHDLLNEYPIAYLKWDHNRDLVDAGSGPEQHAAQRQQTLAIYRLLDELKTQHPGLEIESCASGGARVDLGILDRTDRIWPSDSLDPVERLTIQKFTGVIVAPEMMGSHLTTPKVHSSGRTVDLSFSAATALLGHFGIEWDLTTTETSTRQRIAEWVDLAKEVRPILASGSIVHSDVVDPAIDVRGVIAHDASRAYFTVTQVHSSAAYPAGRVRFPGLDDQRNYKLRVRESSFELGQSPLEWAINGVVISGRALRTTGVRPPVQMPQQATVIELTAV